MNNEKKKIIGKLACPKCKSTNITMDSAQVSLGYNHNVFLCEDCGARFSLKDIIVVSVNEED